MQKPNAEGDNGPGRPARRVSRCNHVKRFGMLKFTPAFGKLDPGS